MPKYSRRSINKLRTCDKLLQDLFNEVIKYYDCKIICGHRNERSQNQAYDEGMSSKKWPESKHNKLPSEAIDVAPHPIDWEDHRRFYMFVGIVRGIAKKMGIKIRCGADWDGDMEVKDQNFHDLPHFEIIK